MAFYSRIMSVGFFLFPLFCINVQLLNVPVGHK